jgi:hypothetical protein
MKYKIEIKWALIMIVSSLLWMVLERAVGLHDVYLDKQMYLTNLFFIVIIWLYVVALKDKKNNFYGRKMTFMQGFVAGLIITAIVTLFSPLTQWLISTVITPHYFDNVIKLSVETGYYKTTAEAQAFFNLENYMKQSTFGALGMGVVLSAIVAFFVKTKSI